MPPCRSAGLSFKALTSLADGDFVFAGHASGQNGWIRDGQLVRWSRVWFVQKVGACEGLSIRVVFAFDTVGVDPRKVEEKPRYRLLFSDANGGFADMELEPNVTDAGVAFTIPAERLTAFSTGRLTLGAIVKSGGLAILIR